MSPLPGPLLHPLASPRKHRVKHRTALLALFSLFTFSCYLLFIAYPSHRLSRSLLTHVPDHGRPHESHFPDHSSDQHTPPLREVTNRFRPVRPTRPTLALSPTEELAALSAFIAALPRNVLPPSVDPNTPLDPQLVLDFDPRSESAKDELDRLVDHIWTRFPVMLFTKARIHSFLFLVFGQLRPLFVCHTQLHSSDSREVRHILDSMHLNPAPLVVEADQRQDAHVLLPLLARLTHVPGLPVLLVGGKPVGSDLPDVKSLMAEIRRLHDDGELTRRVFEAGATVQPVKKKGKGK
ncbi:hypothetical protein JVT61DRAFT_3059 [Boletus reticuloceps]|uniref:Uncharacterized protein n=1 Tax=Boletus reticuloceps TaxID=495285 RepID=A0A8I3AAJ1_9AGAM|nr:hypothetical protein JVT61DRAFT_3059 [Boletus reticuloceps]